MLEFSRCNTDGRNLPCGICPGSTVSYTCTVPGRVSTIWQGSAIHCTGNRITLLHSRFVTGTSSGCPGGTVVAQSLYFNGLHNRYTSLLNITPNSELNNKTIECLYYDSTLIPVESYIITIATGTKLTFFHNKRINLLVLSTT